MMHSQREIELIVMIRAPRYPYTDSPSEVVGDHVDSIESVPSREAEPASLSG